MARINKDQLEDLSHDISSNRNVLILQKQMNEEIEDNNKSDRIYTPQPRFTPKGEKFFEPIKFTNDIPLFEKEKKNQRTRDKFDGYMKEAIKEQNKEYSFCPEYLDHLDDVNIPMLMEKGVDETFQHIQAQEKEARKMLQHIELKEKLDQAEKDSLKGKLFQNEIDVLDQYKDQAIDERLEDKTDFFEEIRQEDLNYDYDDKEPNLDIDKRPEVEIDFSDNMTDFFAEIRQEDINYDLDDKEPDIGLDYDDD